MRPERATAVRRRPRPADPLVFAAALVAKDVDSAPVGWAAGSGTAPADFAARLLVIVGAVRWRDLRRSALDAGCGVHLVAMPPCSADGRQRNASRQEHYFNVSVDSVRDLF